MAYWIFKANPKYYDIDRLGHPKKEINWQAKQHRSEMQPGDIAFIYRTGAEPGIVGTLKLIDTPSQFSETPFEREFCIGTYEGDEWRVNCEIINHYPLIPKDTLLKSPAIQNRANVLDRQGTNFPLSPEEGSAIYALCAL